eukprot:GHVU01040279.1.p1 GENE.GHVU01040279.1~~GHVU01040279.1.p1  ORF type:complete len:113 (-),score=1.30 GHVU01040279.1:791-1129(-)
MLSFHAVLQHSTWFPVRIKEKKVNRPFRGGNWMDHRGLVHLYSSYYIDISFYKQLLVSLLSGEQNCSLTFSILIFIWDVLLFDLHFALISISTNRHRAQRNHSRLPFGTDDD